MACRLARWPWSQWSESRAAGWRWPAGRRGGPGVPGVNRARPPQRVLASVDHLGLTPAHERRVQAIQGLRHTLLRPAPGPQTRLRHCSSGDEQKTGRLVVAEMARWQY